MFRERRQGKFGGIVDGTQVKAIRTESWRSGRTVARRQCFRHPRHRATPGTDGDQAAYQISDHMMQEAVGGKLEFYQSAVAQHRGTTHFTHWRGGLTFCRPETAEILGAQQTARSLGHRMVIEGRMMPPHPTAGQSRTHTMVEQQIPVVPAGRREARMKGFHHRMCPEHGNRPRQVCIHATHPGTQRPSCRRVKVHYLRGGMHPAIGPPGGMHQDRLSGDRSQGLLQRRLHGDRTRLTLPAKEGTAVVLQSQSKPRTGSTVRQDTQMPLTSREASARCSASPSCSTSRRISPAPSRSPISK